MSIQALVKGSDGQEWQGSRTHRIPGDIEAARGHRSLRRCNPGIVTFQAVKR